MAATRSCPKCGGRMEQGFLLELADSNVGRPTQWVGGKPEKNWFGAVKSKGKDQYAVESFRCSRCYLVESYAPPSKGK